MDIDRDKFKTWLESKSGPNYIVGKSSDSCLCPIAVFLNETIDKYSFQVHAVTFSSFDTGVNVLPEWAKKFVFDIDKGITHRSITVKEALIVLGEINGS